MWTKTKLFIAFYHLQRGYLLSLPPSCVFSFLSVLLIITLISWFGLGGQSQCTLIEDGREFDKIEKAIIPLGTNRGFMFPHSSLPP